MDKPNQGFIWEVLKNFEELYFLSDRCILDKLFLYSYMVYSGLGNFEALDLENLNEHNFNDKDLKLTIKLMKRLSEVFHEEQKDAIKIEIEDKKD